MLRRSCVLYWRRNVGFCTLRLQVASRDAWIPKKGSQIIEKLQGMKNAVPPVPPMPSLPDLPRYKDLPNFKDLPSVYSIKKDAMDTLGKLPIQVWYSDSQKRVAMEWNNLVQSVTWNDEDFQENNVANSHPLIILAKTLVELASAASQRVTKPASLLLPVTVGLCLLKKKHAEIQGEILRLTDGCETIDDAKLCHWIYHNARLAQVPYSSDSKAYLLEHTFIRPECILEIKKSELWRPGYVIARSDATCELIVSICGTSNLGDLLLDVSATSVPFLNGKTHRGVLIATKWCYSHLEKKIAKQMKAHPCYKLKLIGHSLGGAVATLMTFKLQDKYNIETITFGSPPVCSKELVDALSSPITNIVLGNDIIPQLSITSIDALEKDLIQANWKEELSAETSSGGISGFISTISEKLLFFQKKEVSEAPEISPVLDIVKTEIKNHQEDAKQMLMAGKANINIASEPTMYLPGDILQLYNTDTESTSYYNNFNIKKIDNNEFATKGIFLSNDMLQDHLLKNYIASSWSSIRSCSKNLDILLDK